MRWKSASNARRTANEALHRRLPSGALRRDPGPRVGLEHRQGQCTTAEDLVVEGAHVEAGAQCLLGFRAQRLDLELTDLVRQRLARPGDVTVHLVLDVLVALAGVLLEEVDRLLARPAELMD